MNRLRDWLTYHSLRAHILAPAWLRIPERTRWRVVHHLNKSRRYCWSDLVDAALGYRENDPCDTSIPLRRQTPPPCSTNCGWLHPDHDGEHDCACYCGKFQFRSAGTQARP